MSSEPHSLIHPTYRHLERKVRLAGLTLGQWTQLVAAGTAAYVLANVLPFGSTYSLSIAVTIAGVPVAASLASGAGRIDPIDQLRALIRWRRHRGLFRPELEDATSLRAKAGIQIPSQWLDDDC